MLDVRAPGAHVEKWEQRHGAARLLGERKALCSMRAKCTLALRHEKKARGHFCFLQSWINIHLLHERPVRLQLSFSWVAPRV